MDDGDVAFDDMLEEEGDWFVQTEDGPFVEPPAEGDVPMGGSEMAVDSENVVVSGGAASSSAVAGGAVSSSAVAEVDGVVAVAGEPVAGAIAVAADGAGEPVEMDERTPERILPVVCPPVTPQRPIARRLFRKTRVQPVEARVLPIRPGASADVKRGDAVDMWQHLTLDAFAKMEPRARCFKVFNKFCGGALDCARRHMMQARWKISPQMCNICSVCIRTSALPRQRRNGRLCCFGR